MAFKSGGDGSRTRVFTKNLKDFIYRFSSLEHWANRSLQHPPFRFHKNGQNPVVLSVAKNCLCSCTYSSSQLTTTDNFEVVAV
jgi:hypothetical protein